MVINVRAPVPLCSRRSKNRVPHHDYYSFLACRERQDLQNVRQDKIRTGIATVAGEVQNGNLVHSVQMNHIGSMEILLLRGLLLQSMKQFKQLATTQEAIPEPQSNTGAMGMSIGKCGAQRCVNCATDPSAFIVGADVSTAPSGRKLRRHR